MREYSVSDLVSEIETRFGKRLNPKVITGLFYKGFLRQDICPIRAGRRLVPQYYVEDVVRELQSRGQLPQDAIFTS